MWKPATSLRGWQCPSCLCVQHSVHLIPFISTQLPNASLALSPSLSLYSFSPLLWLESPPSHHNLIPLQLWLLSSREQGSGVDELRTGHWWQVMEKGGWTPAKWGSIRRRGWRMAPVMGREVVVDEGEEMPLLPHQVWSHAWYTQQHVTSIGAVSSVTRGWNIHSDDGSQAWG